MNFSELQSSHLLDTMQTGIVLHAADTSVLYVNNKALEILQLSREHAIGKQSISPEWHFLDKFGRPMPIEDYPVNRVIATKSPLINFQAGIYHRSGTTTWVNCNAYPEFNEEGEIDYIVVNFIDITDHREAIPFKEIVSRSKSAIMVMEVGEFTEPSSRIIYANQAFYELTGYTQDRIIGQDARILQGKGTDPEAVKEIQQAMAAKMPLQKTLLFYRMDGSEYWSELSIYPLKNDYGDVIYFVGIQHDVTHRTLREEQAHLANQMLREQNAELKQLDEEKNQTMGIVAHDLRNPLYAVAGSLELIKECVSLKDPDLIRIIESSLDRMNAIIEDLLESQLLNTADLKLSKEVRCLAELIHEVHDFYAPHAQKKRIQLLKKAPGSLQACFDYCKLLRAMDNLLSNAIKFSPVDSEVTIGAEYLEGGMVRLFVKDSGPGLTEEDKMNVFKPFQRLSAQPTANEKSTGLGLSIVKKIAELHGGDAGVISQHLHGALFYIDIPE